MTWRFKKKKPQHNSFSTSLNSVYEVLCHLFTWTHPARLQHPTIHPLNLWNFILSKHSLCLAMRAASVVPGAW